VFSDPAMRFHRSTITVSDLTSTFASAQCRLIVRG